MKSQTLSILLLAVVSCNVQASQVQNEILPLQLKIQALEAALSAEQKRVASLWEVIKLQKEVIRQDDLIKKELYVGSAQKDEIIKQHYDLSEKCKSLISRLK